MTENEKKQNSGSSAPSSPAAPTSIRANGVALDVTGNFPGAVAIDLSTSESGVAVGVRGKGLQPAPPPPPVPAFVPVQPSPPRQPAQAEKPAPAPTPVQKTVPAPAAKPLPAAEKIAQGRQGTQGTPKPLLPAGTDIRLPVRGKVVNRHGKRIGKIRDSELFTQDGNRKGTFCKTGAQVFLVQGAQRAAYVDKNDNIFTLSNAYVGTIRRFRWLALFLVLLILLLATLASVALSAFFIHSSGRYAPVIFAADADGTAWDETENLDVFFNERFGDSVIAPGQDGSYRFTIENQNDDTVEFSLDFSEKNPYGIDLVYRLVRDGSYIAGAGGYVPCEELGVDGMTLEARSSTVFELQWLWRDNDPADTAAGENEGDYTLFISFSAFVAPHQTEH